MNGYAALNLDLPEPPRPGGRGEDLIARTPPPRRDAPPGARWQPSTQRSVTTRLPVASTESLEELVLNQNVSVSGLLTLIPKPT
jgi:hypothetical protein